MASDLPPSLRPIQLARTIEYALAYRSNGSGMSTYEAVRYALREAGVRDYADDWVLPVVAMLNDSPSTMIAWAARQTQRSLDRAFGAENVSG